MNFKRLLLFVALFTALQSTGCGEEATSPDGDFDWFFVNYRAYEHDIEIEVNGKPFIAFDDGSGFDSKPTPLIDGDNQVRIICSPKVDPSRFGSEVRILLSPAMIVGAAPLPGLEISQIEGYTEIDLTITMTDDAPERFVWHLNEWADDQKNVLLYENTIDKDAFDNRPTTDKGKSYSDQGDPYREWHYEGDDLINAFYYKPDGSIGSEVKEGNGTYTEWYANGTLGTEVSIEDGQSISPVKLYNEDGTLHREISVEEWNNS